MRTQIQPRSLALPRHPLARLLHHQHHFRKPLIHSNSRQRRSSRPRSTRIGFNRVLGECRRQSPHRLMLLQPLHLSHVQPSTASIQERHLSNKDHLNSQLSIHPRLRSRLLHHLHLVYQILPHARGEKDRLNPTTTNPSRSLLPLRRCQSYSCLRLHHLPLQQRKLHATRGKVEPWLDLR